MNYTYLLRCADGSLYCGWTNRLEERVAAHNAGKGARYTRSHGPVSLAYYEVYGTKEEAMRREAAIKKLTKKQKEELVKTAPAGGRQLKIIISPAKKMQVRTDELPCGSLPVYIEEAKELGRILKGYEEKELKELFGANDKITHENYLRYQSMDPERCLTPAALAYVGIQYQHMAPQVFSGQEWDYICRHLRILSGLYGILRADDGIVPYRLEMQAPLPTGRGRNLYAFWGDRLYQEIRRESGSGPVKILNLASKEYSKAVEPWLEADDEFVTCLFGTLENGKVKVKATEAKMARGEMVRYLAEQQAQEFDAVRGFDRMGFSFSEERSDRSQLVFLR